MSSTSRSSRAPSAVATESSPPTVGTSKVWLTQPASGSASQPSESRGRRQPRRLYDEHRGFREGSPADSLGASQRSSSLRADYQPPSWTDWPPSSQPKPT